MRYKICIPSRDNPVNAVVAWSVDSVVIGSDVYAGDATETLSTLLLTWCCETVDGVNGVNGVVLGTRGSGILIQSS
jgi:hypothetical protein